MTLAMQAAAIADLAPGRFVLGLGSASAPVVEMWNGIPFRRPLSRVRDVTAILRRLLSGERVTEESGTVQVHAARLGRVPKEPIPIYIAALRENMLRMAGQVAEGVILNFVSASDIPRLAEIVRGAAVEVGRDPDAVEIVCRVFVLPTEYRGAGLQVARRFLAGYLTVPTYRMFQDWLGRGETLRPMNEDGRRVTDGARSTPSRKKPWMN